MTQCKSKAISDDDVLILCLFLCFLFLFLPFSFICFSVRSLSFLPICVTCVSCLSMKLSLYTLFYWFLSFASCESSSSMILRGEQTGSRFSLSLFEFFIPVSDKNFLPFSCLHDLFDRYQSQHMHFLSCVFLVFCFDFKTKILLEQQEASFPSNLIPAVVSFYPLLMLFPLFLLHSHSRSIVFSVTKVGTGTKM